MLARIAKIAKEHVLAVAISCLSIGATSGVAAYWSLYESKLNRVEELKIEEFKSIMSENSIFLEKLSDFTLEVSDTGNVDPVVKKELSNSLVRLYTNFNVFKLNLPTEKTVEISQLQTSINEVRKNVQYISDKSGLDPLSVALVDFFRNMKKVQPILEESIGKAIDPSA